MNNVLAAKGLCSLTGMDFITGQLRERLADSAGDSQMNSAIESALAGYTAKRLPPVVTCLKSKSLSGPVAKARYDMRNSKVQFTSSL